jgi:DNA repair exonuclease SbcCD ATPase subunit
MGRKAYFTETEIFEAADRLAAEGKEVSATALLDRLGGGSLTTVYKHLAAWKQDRPAQMQTPQPVDLPDAVRTAFASAWKVAVAESAKDLQAVREKAAEDVKAAQRQFSEALDAIERLEKEAEIEAGKQEALAAKVEELEGALQKSQTENASLKATAEQLQHQVKSQETELERVHKDNDQQRHRHEQSTAELRNEKEAAIKDAAESRGRAEELAKQNSQLLERLTDRKPQ